jgi:cyclophilin family peptidyl-prolyl cis-trans isomerase
MEHFLNIHFIFAGLYSIKNTSKNMKKYVKILLVFGMILAIFTNCETEAQEKSPEQLIKIETSMGDIILKLYNETPLHRDNMIKLIKENFYDEQLFHRVIKDFMVQGGDPHSVGAAKGERLGNGGPGYTIPAEFNPELIHKKGALAAARQGDSANPQKASSGSQFYLVVGRVLTQQEVNSFAQSGAPFTEESIEAYTTMGGTPHLDGSYTVFGEIVVGLEILNSIAVTQTDTYDRPIEDVIYSISLVE